MRNTIDYLVYSAVRVVICLIQSLRIETCHSFAKGLAVFANDILGLRRKLVEENLRRAFPEFSDSERLDLARKMWEHLFLLVAEVAHSPRKIRESNWREHIRFFNVPPLHELLAGSRPLLLVTGHFGNFELGGYILGLLGYPSYAIARTLDNPYLDRFVREFREATGQFLISKNEGYDQILETLEHKDVIAFLADQAAGRKGCWVEFFNREASAYKAIALLSLQYEAPIVVCYATRRENRPLYFDLEVAAVFDPRDPLPGVSNVKEITQWYTKVLEEGIRKNPEQYWWLHDRWKTWGRKTRPKAKPAEN